MYVIGGAQTYSKQSDRYPPGTPQMLRRVDGAWAWPNETVRWLDCTNALGAVILGHNNAAVNHAVWDQLYRGVAFSLPTELEQQMADALGAIMPVGLDAIRYAKNGADVTGAAVRLARAVTDRSIIAMSDTGYHGHHDWSMTRAPKDGGVTQAMKDRTLFFRHGDLDSLRETLEAAEVAAVIIEPIESGNPGTANRGMSFLVRARDLAREYGALLVVDEVVTGMRAPDFSFSRFWGVTPDLLCLGKGIANGFPLSVLLGRREIMDRIEADVFFSTTHGGDAISLAAGIATVAEARRRYLPEVANMAGQVIRDAFHAAAAATDLDAHVAGYNARPVFRFGAPEIRDAFLRHLPEHRILCQGYVNVSLALAEPEPLETLTSAIAQAMAKTATEVL